MPYSGSDIKGMNRRIVYDLLLHKGEMSRAEISRMTGISAPTVLKIVDYLKELGCIQEMGEGESALGRKPNLLRFDASIGYAIGVNFSGVDIKVGIVDFSGSICYKEQFPVVPDFKKVMKEILPEQIRDIVKRSGIAVEKIRGLSIGLPGVVNSSEKTIELAPLVGISDKLDYSVYITDLSDRLSMPVYFENDANMAAMGEFKSREYQNSDDLLFITIGKGLGAGLILGGKLRTGKRYFAGELGYMIFDPAYRVANNNAGWLETNIRLDDLRNTAVPDMKAIDNLAVNLALAIVNICISVDITDVVLGRFKDEEFYKLLIERINYYLRELSVLDINFGVPVCTDPTIVGCAHVIIDSETDRIFN